MQAGNALDSLYICAGLLESSLLNNVIIFFWYKDILLIDQAAGTIKEKYSKTCLKRPLKKTQQTLVFNTNYRLIQVKSIAECSQGPF